MYDKLKVPENGTKITVNSDNSLNIPNNPIIPFIEGDGIGVDIWPATKSVLDAAVKKAYNGEKEINWMEIYAGEKANEVYGEYMPEETFTAIKDFLVAIKGPLTTPVGGGFRSLNVTLRQVLDLYACVRPVRYFNGVPSPVKRPQDVNMVIFRENTEDVYAGIEWKEGTDECKKVIDFLNNEMGSSIRTDSGIGIKPISITGTKRLVKKAIQYAKDQNRDSVTLVHKGNIMKFTEGAFSDWGYEIAKEDFPNETAPEWGEGSENSDGKIIIKDRIADAMLQQIILRPKEYSVLALPNLNGDYISDALAAQVGGLGLAPGANISDTIALFEATHGTAPKYAGQDKVNPGSLILSGVMMLQHLGWNEAAAIVENAMEKTIENKTVTYDLERQLDGATLLKCSEFADAIISNM